MESWLGLYAPKNIPPEILAKLREAAVKSLDDPVVQQKFIDIGGSVPKAERRGGDHMLATVKSDVTRWIDVVKKAGGIEVKE